MCRLRTTLTFNEILSSLHWRHTQNQQKFQTLTLSPSCFFRAPMKGRSRPLNRLLIATHDAAVSRRNVVIELCRRVSVKMALTVMTLVEGLDLKLRCWSVFCKPYGHYRSLSDENRIRKRKNTLWFFFRGRQTVEVKNKFCRSKHLNHVAKPPVRNLDTGVKAMCDSSCLDPVLQNAHRDVANDQTQKTSHSHRTSVLEVITVFVNVDSNEADLFKSTVNCP